MTTPATPDAPEPRQAFILTLLEAVLSEPCSSAESMLTRAVEALHETVVQLRRDVDALAPAPAPVPAAAGEPRVTGKTLPDDTDARVKMGALLEGLGGVAAEPPGEDYFRKPFAHPKAPSAGAPAEDRSQLPPGYEIEPGAPGLRVVRNRSIVSMLHPDRATAIKAAWYARDYDYAMPEYAPASPPAVPTPAEPRQCIDCGAAIGAGHVTVCGPCWDRAHAVEPVEVERERGGGPALHLSGEQDHQAPASYCDVCGERRDKPHSWRECAEAMSVEREQAFSHATLAARERDTARAELARAQGTIEAAHRALGGNPNLTLRQRVELLRNEVGDLQRDLAAARGERDHYRDQLSHANDALSELEDAHGKLRDVHAEEMRQHNALREEYERACKQIRELHALLVAPAQPAAERDGVRRVCHPRCLYADKGHAGPCHVPVVDAAAAGPGEGGEHA